jgi:hypothetical protein
MPLYTAMDKMDLTKAPYIALLAYEQRQRLTLSSELGLKLKIARGTSNSSSIQLYSPGIPLVCQPRVSI